MICYVLGANPPLHVIEGFVKRIWKSDNIDKLGSVAKGVFIVRFKSQEDVNKACESNGILFDRNPFIVRPLEIPVWVKFPGLGVHYWGEQCLRLIAGMLGPVIRLDNATLDKDRMQYVLMELKTTGPFYDTIAFTNEDDELMRVNVEYDWKPTQCKKCKQLGHLESSCRTGTTQMWVLKTNAKKVNQQVDAKGFQIVQSKSKSARSGSKEEKSSEIVLSKSNGFAILDNEVIPEVENPEQTVLGTSSHPPNR